MLLYVRARLGSLSELDAERLRAVVRSVGLTACDALVFVRDEAHLREMLASFENERT